ncbi:MAG: Rdx family protein [Ferruginibacter sp.]
MTATNPPLVIELKPTITIEYCPKCGWMLRAAYMAQEFLTTFQNELKGVFFIAGGNGW